MKHLVIKIYGLVQDVGFRYSAKREVDRLHLVGFARNEDDGSVYVEVEGDEKNLRQFLEWCHAGPDTAEVRSVEEEWRDEVKNLEGFEML